MDLHPPQDDATKGRQAPTSAGTPSPGVVVDYEFKAKQLERELQILRNRYNSVLVILVGCVVLFVGDYIEEQFTDIWLVLFPVISAILIVFGLYNYFVAEQI